MTTATFKEYRPSLMARWRQWWFCKREDLALWAVSLVLRTLVPDDSSVAYAKRELPLHTKEEGLDFSMRKHLLLVVRLSGIGGYSGASRAFFVERLKRLLLHRPLGPLTGEEDEWTDDQSRGYRQNRRRASIFQDTETGVAYDDHGFLFRDEVGIGLGDLGLYGSLESRKVIKFPYDVPDEAIILDMPKDATREQRIEAIRAAGVPDDEIMALTDKKT